MNKIHKTTDAIPAHELIRSTGQDQQYYYTKIQKHVYVAIAVNLLASVLFVAAETYLYLTVSDLREDYFPAPFEDVHLLFLACFILTNTFFHVILVIGTKTLNLRLLSTFIIYETFFLCTAAFVVALTLLDLHAWPLYVVRMFIFIPAIVTFLNSIRMYKITKHEQSND